MRHHQSINDDATKVLVKNEIHAKYELTGLFGYALGNWDRLKP
jgi:hypothetical protein